MSVTLRRAEPNDALAVAQVHVRSWQAGYRGLLPDDYLDGLIPEDRAARYTFGQLPPDRPATFVALDGDEVCGFVTTGPSRDDDTRGLGEVLALYVDPPCWGRGAGQALMHDARARLAHAGFRDAQLWVLVGNERAERFYRADGWVPDGSRRRDQIYGVEVDEVRFRRSLG
jgi:ribosomal protein S18 acetylase RimI-like enzyme